MNVLPATFALGLGLLTCSCTMVEDFLFPPPLDLPPHLTVSGDDYPYAPDIDYSVVPASFHSAPYHESTPYNPPAPPKSSGEPITPPRKQDDPVEQRTPSNSPAVPVPIPSSADEFLKRYSR